MWNGETYDFTSRRWVIDEAWDFRAHYCLDIRLVNLGVWLNVKKYCSVWHRLTYGWKDVKSNKTFVWLTQRCERWRLTRIQTMRQTHEHPAKKKLRLATSSSVWDLCLFQSLICFLSDFCVMGQGSNDPDPRETCELWRFQFYWVHEFTTHVRWCSVFMCVLIWGSV